MAQTQRVTKEELQEDKFIEFVMQVYAFLQRHTKTLIILGIVVVIALAAVSLYFYQKEQAERAASLKMSEGLAAFSEAESLWLDAEKHQESLKKFQQAEQAFAAIVEKYGGSSYVDKALFYQGKSAYFRKEYDQAVASFERLVKGYPKSLFALHAQLALGRTYEQLGGQENLLKAVEALAPEKFTRFAQLPLQERQQVEAMALLDQARCYEKLERFEDALRSYQQIVETFENNLQNAITQRSHEALRLTKDLVKVIRQDLTGVDASVQQALDAAAAAEAAGNYFQALVSTMRGIHLYRILKENQKSLDTDMRQRILALEKRTETFVEGVQDAEKAWEEARLSTALYNYERALGGSAFAPERSVYETARAARARLQAVLGRAPTVSTGSPLEAES